MPTRKEVLFDLELLNSSNHKVKYLNQFKKIIKKFELMAKDEKLKEYDVLECPNCENMVQFENV